MASFFVLVAPIPVSIRRKVIDLLSASSFVKSAQTALRFTLIFILILFTDSVTRVYRVQKELEAAHESSLSGAITDRSEIQARRFYAQRNMYLCGFTLFLSLILARTYGLVVKNTQLKEQVIAFTKKNPTTGSSSSGSSSASSLSPSTEKEYKEEIQRLQKELNQKNLDLKTLKEQSQSLSKEYFKVADQLNVKSGTSVSDKKHD